MTNPVVRVLFRDGAVFTIAAMTVVASFAFGAANRCRCPAGFGPRLFRGTGFDQNYTPLVHSVEFPRHPLDQSVSQIHCIESHVTFLLPGALYAHVEIFASFRSHAAPIRQELLSNTEQF
jgi:hypothetical protein